MIQAVNTIVVVISLPGATDRRAAFSARAGGAGLEWRYFDASQDLGPELSYDPDDAVVAKGRPLCASELGCYASHHRAWREFLDSAFPQMIVLEDDTIVDWAFLEKVASVDLQASGISYLRLFAKRPCAFRRWQPHAIEPLRYLIEYLDYAYGTQAYVITRRGAERFLRHCRRVRRPIDDELDRSWDHGIPNLCIFPFPVIEQSVPSGIGSARFQRAEIPARLATRRRRAKVTERVLKLRRRLRGLFPEAGPALVSPLSR